MPGLLTLTTNLKSLKYGQDTPGGGDSGQPYIKTDINTVDSGFNRFRLTRFDDGLIRGGAIGVLNASVVDTLRIGKFFVDFPKGPLFLVKQVGLQLSNPRLETRAIPNVGSTGIFGSVINSGINFLNNNSIGPTRIYNLGINTLAQVPVNAIGGHIVRHGLTPIPNENSYYINVVRDNNKTSIIPSQLLNTAVVATFAAIGLERFAPRLIPDTFTKSLVASSNRLVKLTAKLNLNPRITGTPSLADADPNIITKYIGGPESVYGIGNTVIKRHGSSTQKEDWTANKYAVEEAKKEGKDKNKLSIDDLNKNLRRDTVEKGPSSYPKIPAPVIPTNVYGSMKTYAEIAAANQLTNTNVQNLLVQTTANFFGGPLAGALIAKNLPPVNQLKIIASGSDGRPLKTNGSIGYSTSNPGNIIYQNWNGEKVIITGSWTWNSVSREQRVGSFGSATYKDKNGNVKSKNKADSINLTPLFDRNKYWSADPIAGSDRVIIDKNVYNVRDLIKFRIQAVNTDSPDDGKWMAFRAYITQYSDNVDAQWNPVKYAGRGDKFYIYDGFDRKINIGFKVAALSAVEMKPMYQKLNYLMSNLMPDYSGVLMRGPLTRMTVGNWIDCQLGILTSLSYTITNDTPWEIALDEPEGGIKQLILPHIVEVTLNFTPIGSETEANNLLSRKSDTISHIAQNNTGDIDFQYIRKSPKKKGSVIVSDPIATDENGVPKPPTRR